MKKNLVPILLAVLFIAAVTPVVVLAGSGGGGGGGLENIPSQIIPSQILTPLQGVTESIIRLAIFIMGLLLPLGVLVGVAKAGFHHTLGNSAGVSSGIMLAISALAAFVFGLLMMRSAPVVAKSVSEKYLSSQTAVLEDITTQMSQSGSVADVDPEHLFDNAEVKDLLSNLLAVVLRIVFGIAVLILFVAVALGGTQSSLGAVLANPRLLGSGLGRALVAIALLVAVIVSVPLTKAIAHALLPSLLPGTVVYVPTF